MPVPRSAYAAAIAGPLLLAGLLVAGYSASGLNPPASKLVAPHGLRPLPQTLDFGRVNPYTDLERTVRIQNDGPNPVTLSGVQSSCSCTLAALEQYTVPAGGSVNLKIRLDLPHYNADVVRTKIMILPEDPRIPSEELSVIAEIIPEFEVEPPELDLGKLKQGTVRKCELRVRRTGIAKAKLIGVEAPPEWIASFKAEDADRYIVTLVPKPEAALGLHSGLLALLTDVSRRPRLKVPIRVDVTGMECTVTPKVIVFGPSEPGATLGVIEVRNPEPLALEEVFCTTSHCRWDVNVLEQGRLLRVVLSVAPDAPQGKLAGKLTLTLKEGQLVEKREIPFYGAVQLPLTPYWHVR